MILDVIVVAIFLIGLIIGIKNGVAKTLVSFLGSMLCFSLSAFIGDILSKNIYDNYISHSIVDSVSSSLSTDGLYSVDSSFESLPPFVQFSLNFTGFDVTDSLTNTISDAPSNIANIVENTISSVVIAVLSFILTSLLFIVIFAIFKFLLMRPIVRVFKIPVMRGFDSLLGAVCSLFSCILLVSFLAFLLRVIMPYVDDMPYIFSESTIYNSYIFYHFYNGNIFYTLTSLF